MTGPTRLYGSSSAASALVDSRLRGNDGRADCDGRVRRYTVRERRTPMDSRLRGNDDSNLDSVIPAKAGIHAASPEHDRALAGTASNPPARQRGQVP